MTRILLIDDDRKLGDLLGTYFKGFELELTQALVPSEGLSLLKKNAATYGAVILDVMLPEFDGFEACRRIRAFSQVPILMLTARGEVMDRVLGLETGVDDYLPKPFEPRELVARLKSLLRRAKIPHVASRLKSGELVLDLGARSAELAGVDLGLSSLEFALLKLFMSHPSQLLTRDRILDDLRGVDWEAYNRSIDVAVSRLRQKLGDSARAPRFLKTVWGDGYTFIAPVEDAA